MESFLQLNVSAILSLKKKKIQRIAKKLLQIAQENIVQFLRYSLRPSILVFEYCELNIDGEFVHTVSQVLEIWNDDEKYNFWRDWTYQYNLQRVLKHFMILV